MSSPIRSTESRSATNSLRAATSFTVSAATARTTAALSAKRKRNPPTAFRLSTSRSRWSDEIISAPSEDLFVCQQLRSQFFIIHFLYGTFRVDCQARSRRDGLAENHEHRFHANRTIGNV